MMLLALRIASTKRIANTTLNNKPLLQEAYGGLRGPPLKEQECKMCVTSSGAGGEISDFQYLSNLLDELADEAIPEDSDDGAKHNHETGRTGCTRTAAQWAQASKCPDRPHVIT